MQRLDSQGVIWFSCPIYGLHCQLLISWLGVRVPHGSLAKKLRKAEFFLMHLRLGTRYLGCLPGLACSLDRQPFALPFKQRAIIHGHVCITHHQMCHRIHRGGNPATAVGDDALVLLRAFQARG
jgi:hypothetical protein